MKYLLTNRCYILLTLMLYCAIIAHAQERRMSVSIDFRINSTVIDSAYSDNAANMRKISDLITQLQQNKTVSIINVSFCGAASPEGSYQLNRRLAQGRLSALERFVRTKADIPDSIITYTDNYIQWDYLKSHIEDSEYACKNEALAILNEEGRLVDYYLPNTHIDNRLYKLKALDGGKVWFQISRRLFGQMRNAGVVIITYKEELPSVLVPQYFPEIASIGAEEDVIRSDYGRVNNAQMLEDEEWNRKLYLKSNALGLGIGIPNVAVEVDLAKHWSFTLPVYYSAWNYFKSTIKFRTLAFQPELRYWLKENNQKFFIGAHFGYAQYNFAVDGDYRIQDHNGNSPALGGGISMGYRIPVSRNNRWRVEFSLGAGVYGLHYDKFHNPAHTEDGLMINSVKKTYFGIDQAAVSFSYSFDLKKKGGRR